MTENISPIFYRKNDFICRVISGMKIIRTEFTITRRTTNSRSFFLLLLLLFFLLFFWSMGDVRFLFRCLRTDISWAQMACKIARSLADFPHARATARARAKQFSNGFKIWNSCKIKNGAHRKKPFVSGVIICAHFSRKEERKQKRVIIIWIIIHHLKELRGKGRKRL